MNKKTLKISYSCTANIKKIIQTDNKKALKKRKKGHNESSRKCNCQKSKREKYPLRCHCKRKNVVYEVTTSGPNLNIYVGVTESVKARWQINKQSFKNPEYKDATAFSSFILKKKMKDEPNIKMEIIDGAPSYCAGQRSCQLCLTEKLQILKHRRMKICLNLRNELAQMQMCHHKAFYRLGRIKV